MFKLVDVTRVEALDDHRIQLEFSDGKTGIAKAPVQMPSAVAATSRARSLADSKAGVIAFARSGDPDIGEFADAEVLFKAGEVLDNVFDVE